MADSPYSAKDIEKAITANDTAEVKRELNYDHLHLQPEDFATICKQMEGDGKVRLGLENDGTISKVSLKDGYFEFLGSQAGETTVFDKSDYSKGISSVPSLMTGGFSRVISGALSPGNDTKPKE